MRLKQEAIPPRQLMVPDGKRLAEFGESERLFWKGSGAENSWVLEFSFLLRITPDPVSGRGSLWAHGGCIESDGFFMEEKSLHAGLLEV